MIRKIEGGGHHTNITIVGEDRNADIGLFISTDEDLSIDQLTISNVFIPLVVTGSGSVTIHEMSIRDYGGDAINIRKSNFTIHSLVGRNPTPTRPYNSVHRQNSESVIECLSRSGVSVYDPTLLSFQMYRGREVILGYHTDQVAQMYAVKSDGYTVDQDGVIDNVHIRNIDCQLSQGSQGFIASEGCGVTNCSFGTESLRIVGSGYPYPLVFNTASDLTVGNKERVEIDRGGVVRVANSKRTLYESKNIRTLGIDIVGYSEQMKTSKRKTLLAYSEELRIEYEVLVAIAKQESSSTSFRFGLPVMLFEGHVFERCIRKAGYSPSSLISDNRKLGDIIKITPYRKYGSYRNQKRRYELATSVDQECAIMACSWGKFQLLGENWEMVGCESANDLFRTMGTEQGQLDLFIAYLRAKDGLVEALRDKDWLRIKQLYQGYKQHDRNNDGQDDYVASLIRHYTRTVQSRNARKPLSKSRTMRNTTVGAIAKVAAGSGVLYNSEGITSTISELSGKLSELENIKALGTDTISRLDSLTGDVSGITTALTSLSWLPYAVVVLLLIAIYPHIMVAIAYMRDNGYIGDRSDIDDYD